ncbi:hypothetical protein C1645_760192 [Glomus cerebriforme]|uniref:SAM domain-containing protein n=1 Tax=Glomus cerebriforme TaxID=658196 RepID=A0A397TAQ4_9GLOM|nr:hypothetical protein C1645_760192 [Glomus cerebriforme]
MFKKRIMVISIMLQFLLLIQLFNLLCKRKMKRRSFLLMNEEKLEYCGLEMGPALLLAEVIKSLKENKKLLFLPSKGILAKCNIGDNSSIGTICQYPPSDDKKLRQNVNETKLKMNKQKTSNITSTISLLSKRSIGTQTTNFSADPKSLTYLIQGLISRSLSYFFLDESLLFINGKTEGVCKISSVDPRLSSVSLYCEYKLGNSYIHKPPPGFSGYPISLKSPFSPDKEIVTGLDWSKSKFIDNPNYVIEFVEMIEVEELVKSSLNISEHSTGEIVKQTSASLQTRTVTTQTKPIIDDKKALTYIAKGIMFKSICFFAWDEQEAFNSGKKKGILQLTGSDPRLARMTLTCNYKLSNCLISFQGDLGYPMIVSCSYGSVKTLLKYDRKEIMDNFNYKLTFLS